MKLSRHFLLPAALLVLAARPAIADGGVVGRPTYRRPAQLQQPIAPTAAAHLSTAQLALQTALDAMETFANTDSTLNYGGYFARAKEDATNAKIALTEAIAFVSAHPEQNVLAAGPAPVSEPKAPALPGLSTETNRAGQPLGIPSSNEVTAVDALQVALAALVNNPAPDYRGPVLGDLGGRRTKLIAAIGQIGADMSNGLAYHKYVRGGASGVIPLSAPVELLPDPKYGPTARTYLTFAAQTLDRLRVSSERDATRPYPPKVLESLKRATARLADATAYLETHPEADALKPGPAGPEPSSVRRARAPSFSPKDDFQTRRVSQTASVLNEAIGWLLNNPDPGYRGPVLGDLGGHRGKILDEIGQALTDTLADYRGPAPAPRGTRTPAP